MNDACRLNDNVYYCIFFSVFIKLNGNIVRHMSMNHKHFQTVSKLI